jgi:hypothetical protein
MVTGRTPDLVDPEDSDLTGEVVWAFAGALVVGVGITYERRALRRQRLLRCSKQLRGRDTRLENI